MAAIVQRRSLPPFLYSHCPSSPKPAVFLSLPPQQEKHARVVFFMAAVILPVFALLEIPRPSRLFVLVDGGQSV